MVHFGFYIKIITKRTITPGLKEMIYSFSANNRGSKFLDIEFTIENNKDSEVYVQLPAWRPGRYELANFAKNIKNLEARTLNNKVLKFKKKINK